MPISETPPPRRAPEPGNTDLRQIGRVTVLLVEDHPDVSVVASDYLEQAGCQVLLANSAEAAIDALNKRRDIDLVLSDIVMPGMSGLEFGRLVPSTIPK